MNHKPVMSRPASDAGLKGPAPCIFDQSHSASSNRVLVPVLYLPVKPFRSLSDMTLLPVKLVKRRRRDAQEQQAACQTPFQLVQFLSNQSAHSFFILSFLKSKSSRPLRDESLSFVFPPNFICPSPDIPLKVLSNPDPVSGAPGKAYCCSARLTQKCTSAPYPCPLPLSGLAWPSSECLLFSSSFC